MTDENVRYIAVFLIAAKNPRKEFDARAQVLVDKGQITRDEIPKILDKICKMKGNAGEIGREIRDELKREGWKP
ncbi:MAG: hypothetical protein RTU30_00660 [Candidatus Thorarchaeota archaeon]